MTFTMAQTFQLWLGNSRCTPRRFSALAMASRTGTVQGAVGKKPLCDLRVALLRRVVQRREPVPVHLKPPWMSLAKTQNWTSCIMLVRLPCNSRVSQMVNNAVQTIELSYKLRIHKYVRYRLMDPTLAHFSSAH